MDWKKAEQAWKETTEPSTGSGYAVLPEGTYLAIMRSASVQKGKYGDQFAMLFTIRGGNFDGAKVAKYHSLEEDSESGFTYAERIQWLRNDIERAGIKGKTTLESALTAMTEACQSDYIGVELKVKAKQSKGKTYNSIYINKRVAIEGDKPVDQNYEEVAF